MGWTGYTILQVAKKAIVGIQFLKLFCNSLMNKKNVINVGKTFYGIPSLHKYTMNRAK